MIELFYRLRHFILLISLLVVSVLVMANANSSLMWGIRAWTLKFVGAVEYRMSRTTEIILSVRENRELRTANLQLTSELARLRIADRENAQLREALGWQRRQEQETVAARIIARERFGATNFLTLDAGREQGVDVDMAVISHLGILGRVIQVSDNYSQVMPYLHSQFHVPAMIDTLGAIGIVSGRDGTPNLLAFDHVVKTENIQIGQRVTTHEASEVFPPNIPVGTIESYRTEPGSNFWTIKVRPAAPLHTTHFAFVVPRQSERVKPPAEFSPDL